MKIRYVIIKQTVGKERTGHMRFSVICSLLLLLMILGIGSAGINAPGAAIRLTSEDGIYKMNPVWSPDGSKIAFTGRNYAGLWIINSNGSDLRQISDEPGSGYGFSWSTDSKSIVARVARFEKLRRFNAVKLYDLENNSARQLTDYVTRMPVLPQWINFDQNVLLLKSGQMEVVDSGKKIMLKAGRPAAKICFWQNEKIMVYEPEKNSSTTLDPFPGSRYLNPQLSPDGSKIAFEVAGKGIFVMSNNGAMIIELGEGRKPRWSPDSGWLIYSISRDDGYQITSSDLFIIRADGNEKTAITKTDTELEMNPDWSPRGNQIAFDTVYGGYIYVINLEVQ